MPLIYNDAIDDIPVLDRQSVFAQQRSNARANLLGESECALLQNVTTSSTGVCKSRRGFHYVATLPGSGTVQGAAFFDSSTEHLVVVRGGTIYVLNSSFSSVNEHGLKVGDVITIAGVDGNFNGTHTVATVSSTTSFTVTRGSLFTVNVSYRSSSGGVVTLTTAAAHGLSAGNLVTVSGVSAAFNGTFYVSAVPSATTFSYFVDVVNVAITASAGSVTTNLVSSMVSGGSFSVDTVAAIAVSPTGSLSLDNVPATATSGTSTLSTVPSFEGAGRFLLDTRPSVASGGKATHVLSPFGVHTVTNKAFSAGVVTLTTSAAHGFASGQSVSVSEVDTLLNGTVTVASVPSTNTFTYLKSLAPISTRKEIAAGAATITFADPHNFLVGDTFTVTSAGGAFNGSFTVATVPTTTTFTYSRSVAVTVSNKSLSSGVATITTATDHNLLVGNTVAVSSVDNTFNGSYVVASVPTDKTFTYARSLSSSVTNKALAAGVATLTTSAAHNLAVGGVVAISGVKDFGGNYTVTGVPTTTTLTFAKTLTDKSLATRAQSGTTITLSTAESHINSTTNGGSTSNRASFAQIANTMFVSTGNSGEKLVQISMATGSPVYSLSTETISAHRLIAAQNFRLFTVANATGTSGGSTIYTSDFLPAAPTMFTGSANFDVGQDYDDITALVSGPDFTLFVFKERSIFAIGTAPTAETGTPTSVAAFTVRQLSRDIGCVSARSVVQIGNDTFFLSLDGVRTLQRTIADGMTAIQPPISEPIDDVIRRINWTAAEAATAVYRDRKYILALPLDSATVPSHIVVFDTVSGGWALWTGVLPIELVNVSFTESKLLSISSDTISEFTDYVKETNLLPVHHQEKVAAYSNLATGNYLYIGTATITGLTIGASYSFTMGANEASFDAYPNTYTTSGSFIAKAVNAVFTSIYAPFDGIYPLTATLIQSPYTSPTLKLTSRAMTFGEPLNPKIPDYIELEFDRGSNMRVDVSVILDNSDEFVVASNVATGGGSTLVLPFTLPAVLPRGAITRKRISMLGSGFTTLSALDDVNPARDMQVVITPASGLTDGEAEQSKVLQIRGMVASAFVEALEGME
jgi:hypothetical protein